MLPHASTTTSKPGSRLHLSLRERNDLDQDHLSFGGLKLLRQGRFKLCSGNVLSKAVSDLGPKGHVFWKVEVYVAVPDHAEAFLVVLAQVCLFSV